MRKFYVSLRPQTKNQEEISMNCVSKNERVFNEVVNGCAGDIVRWLCSRYAGLRLEDSEDIVMETVMALWERVIKMGELTRRDMLSMWRRMTLYRYTHWLRGQRFTEEWDDSRLQYGWEERDYGWDRGAWDTVMRRERLDEALSHRTQKDQRLIQLSLEGLRDKEIGTILGYKSANAVKNRRHLIKESLRCEMCSDIIAA